MTSSDLPRERTRMFARVIGPYLAIVAFSAALHPDDMRSMVSGFEADPLWPWVTGAFTLPLGLIVIALHPYWRGVAAVLVSGLGWLTAIKGLFLVTASHSYFAMAHSAVASTGWWVTAAAIEVVIGLYLTFIGWVPARDRSVSEKRSTATDLPRAA